MENLHWIEDYRDCLSHQDQTASVNTSCCTKNELLPAGCAMVILELIRQLAVSEHCPGLQKAAEKCIAERQLPALAYGLCDERTAADSFCQALGKQMPLSPAEQQLIYERNCVTLGMAMYICFMAEQAVKTSDITLTMNLEAVRGELGAFDARLHEIGRPYPGQIECAENVRRINQNSEATTNEGRYAYGYDTKPRVQDAICIRAAPQTHGGVRDILHWCQRQVLRDWNTEAAQLYRTEYAMSALATALADLTHISERRTFRLNDSKLSYGLPMNLVPNDVGINYGFAIIQSTQAAQTAEVKLLTLPTTAVKRGGECMAYASVSRHFELLRKMNRVFAVEWLMSAQGMDIVRRKVPGISFGKGSEAALQCLRDRVTMMEKNRFVAPDMITAEQMIDNGTLLHAVEAAVGPLK